MGHVLWREIMALFTNEGKHRIGLERIFIALLPWYARKVWRKLSGFQLPKRSTKQQNAV